MISVITPSIRPQYLDITQKTLENQTYQDFEWLTEIGLPSRGFMLPWDFNKMLKRSEGKIIVILEDCITLTSTALEAISKLDHTKTAYTYPVGLDWRLHGYGLIDPPMWEIDFASAPREMFFKVGGFDEEFCKGWSWENVELAWRAEAAGYGFECSHVAKAEKLDHDKYVKHPFRNRLKNNDVRANNTRTLAKTGSFKLNYL